MPNVAICYISITKNINFNNVKGFADTKMYRKFTFQGL